MIFVGMIEYFIQKHVLSILKLSIKHDRMLSHTAKSTNAIGIKYFNIGMLLSFIDIAAIAIRDRVFDQ